MSAPLAEALPELHAIVGDDIDPAETLAELRKPSGHLLAGVEALRARVAELEAERGCLRALVREQVSCECSDDESCMFVRERDQARAERDRLARIVRDLVDGEEPCRRDHHGGCQEHGYLSLEPGERCPMGVAMEIAGKAAGVTP